MMFTIIKIKEVSQLGYMYTYRIGRKSRQRTAILDGFFDITTACQKAKPKSATRSLRRIMSICGRMRRELSDCSLHKNDKIGINSKIKTIESQALLHLQPKLAFKRVESIDGRYTPWTSD